MFDLSKIVEEKAGEDDRDALLLLGKNFLKGTGGFKKNLDKAEKHLRKASDLRHPEADLILGKLLLDRAKNVEAFNFIQRAAEIEEDADAQWLLGKFDEFYETFILS